MSEILLDSDVIIAWLRGYEPIAGAIFVLLEKGHGLLWTPVSIAEIFTGVAHAGMLRHWTLNKKHYPMKDIRLHSPDRIL